MEGIWQIFKYALKCIAIFNAAGFLMCIITLHIILT